MPIDPVLPGGFRDYLPQDMIPRQRMFDTIRSVFERFGFVPLGTPAIEREATLTGGDPGFSKQIFRIKKGGRETAGEELALRFDLTVPLARVTAQYPSELRRPFKRYQMGLVWRGEKPQAGRFYEFIQFDADIVGSANMMADAEIVAVMYETMVALGFSRFVIRVNNRKILNGLAEYAGFSSEESPKVLRVIDKLDKAGWEGVSRELGAGIPAETAGDLSNSEAVEAVPGIGLAPSAIAAIKQFIDLRAGTQRETLAAVGELMASSPIAQEGVRELREVVECAEALDVPSDAWTIDLSVARGLGYYTGPVFETILTDLPSIGSVFSGGRYDDLVSRFGSTVVPATGASVGVDRLFAAMETLKLVKQERAVAKVLILNFEGTARSSCARIATALRRGGIPTEIFLGAETTLKGQLAFAVRQEYPIVVIVGADEVGRSVAKVKDMAKRIQVEVPQEAVLDTVRGIV